MSEGPIKSARDAWKPPRVSTPQSSAVHGPAPWGRGYCGRKSTAIAKAWTDVTCADCIAARAADAPLSQGSETGDNQ